MTLRFTNNASAEIAASIDDVDTTITLNTGQGSFFPSLTSGQAFYATLFDSSNNIEIVRVTGRTGDALTVVRGQDGTVARGYVAGSKLELRVVAAVLDEFMQKNANQNITGDNTFSGKNQFTGITTFTQTIEGSIDGNAATVTNGVYTTGDQTIGGNKTFSGYLTVSGLRLYQDAASIGFELGPGVGTGNTNAQGFYVGSGKTLWFGANAGGGRMTLDGSGNFAASGNVTAYSDERLKKDWKLICAREFVQAVSHVKAGTYTRTDTGERQVGVSAQSLRVVLPEAVIEDDEGTLSVAYGNAALAVCIALAREVESLRARVEELEAR